MVNLGRLMSLSRGRPEVVVAILDGTVAEHDQLSPHVQRMNLLGERVEVAVQPGLGTEHGTFTAGILAGNDGSDAPSICPGCTVLAIPLLDTAKEVAGVATEKLLSNAVATCVELGAHVINISASMTGSPVKARRELHAALDFAQKSGVVVVAASGDGGLVSGSPLLQHAWVIPVVGYGVTGHCLPGSNLGQSIGRRGLGAPGEDIKSLSPHGYAVGGGSSAATAFVSGGAALLRSLVATASGSRLRNSLLLSARRSGAASVVPPLFDAWASYQLLATQSEPCGQ
jgi:subtilisin family serine protease